MNPATIWLIYLYNRFVAGRPAEPRPLELFLGSDIFHMYKDELAVEMRFDLANLDDHLIYFRGCRVYDVGVPGYGVHFA